MLAASFVAGGLILLLEILGAKMLAPYFGRSHFVWTAQIAVTLAALAVGYRAGGSLSSRTHTREVAVFLLMAAAAWCAQIPLVLDWLSRLTLPFGIVGGSVLASLGLFFVPIALLAAAGPIFIRLALREVSAAGTIAGRLACAGTLGSVAGAVIAGYSLWANELVLVTGSVLVFASAVFLVDRVLNFRAAILLVLPLASCLLGTWGAASALRPHFKKATELERVNSPFGTLQVLAFSNSPIRLFMSDFLVVNTYDTHTGEGHDAYTHILNRLAHMYHQSSGGNALCIGIAAGIVPMQLAQSGLTVDAVEINPTAVSIASSFFGFDTNKVRTFIQDGRYYLNKAETLYDIVILDAYIGESCPNHLLSRESFSQIRRILKPGGILVMSSSADSQGGSQFFVGSVQKTLRAVFKQLRTHDTFAGNVFFVAGDHPLTPLPLSAPSFLPEEIRWVTERTLGHPVFLEEPAGIVLTDDYNPIDFYDARNRQAIRRKIFEGTKEL